jgi:hypothetical protein
MASPPRSLRSSAVRAGAGIRRLRVPSGAWHLPYIQLLTSKSPLPERLGRLGARPASPTRPRQTTGQRCDVAWLRGASPIGDRFAELLLAVVAGGEADVRHVWLRTVWSGCCASSGNATRARPCEHLTTFRRIGGYAMAQQVPRSNVRATLATHLASSAKVDCRTGQSHFPYLQVLVERRCSRRASSGAGRARAWAGGTYRANRLPCHPKG